MHQPTDAPTAPPPPVYRVTADGLIHGHTFPTVEIPAPASGDEIAAAVYAALGPIRSEAEIDVEVDIDLAAGTGTVWMDEDEIPLTVTGPGVSSPADYWLRLAADLRQAAGLVATLAGTPAPAGSVAADLWLPCSAVEVDGLPELVDRMADAFGSEAGNKKVSYGWERQFGTTVGELRVGAFARIPAPEDPEVAALRARIAELEAQQAGGVQ